MPHLNKSCNIPHVIWCEEIEYKKMAMNPYKTKDQYLINLDYCLNEQSCFTYEQEKVYDNKKQLLMEYNIKEVDSKSSNSLLKSDLNYLCIKQCLKFDNHSESKDEI